MTYVLDALMVASIAFVIWLILFWHHAPAAPELRHDGEPLNVAEMKVYAAILRNFSYESAPEPDRRHRSE